MIVINVALALLGFIVFVMTISYYAFPVDDRYMYIGSIILMFSSIYSVVFYIMKLLDIE
jgi:hypothetical protein